MDAQLRAAFADDLECGGGASSSQRAAAAAAAAEAVEAADIAAALAASASELTYVPPAFEAHKLDGQVRTLWCPPPDRRDACMPLLE